MTDFRSDSCCLPLDELLNRLAPILRQGNTPCAVDEITQSADRRFCEISDRAPRFFALFSGTAANVLLARRFAEIICHRDFHISLDECGAVEFQSGARLVPVGVRMGRSRPKISPR